MTLTKIDFRGCIVIFWGKTLALHCRVTQPLMSKCIFTLNLKEDLEPSSFLNTLYNNIILFHLDFQELNYTTSTLFKVEPTKAKLGIYTGGVNFAAKGCQGQAFTTPDLKNGDKIE